MNRSQNLSKTTYKKSVHQKTNIRSYFPSLCLWPFEILSALMAGYLIYGIWGQLSKSRRLAYKNAYTPNATPKRAGQAQKYSLQAHKNSSEQQRHPAALRLKSPWSQKVFSGSNNSTA